MPRGGVDPGDPQATEVALAVAAIAVAILIGFEDRLLGGAVMTAGVTAEALRHLQGRTALLARVHGTLDATHRPGFFARSSVFTRGAS